MAANNYRWVEASGMVTFLGDGGDNAFLELAGGEAQVQLRTVSGQPAFSRLARNVPVRVHGVCEGIFDEKATRLPGWIWIPPTNGISVIETANGFGLLAVVISYLPVLYQSFSKREASISLLDARAGSPSSAVELLRRHHPDENFENLKTLLGEWERWSAELLESHLSYPVLCYFRSQHDNQSWLRALTTVLDTCALVMVGLKDGPAWQARMTFAMTRHAVVDIAQVLKRKPSRKELCIDRLNEKEFNRMQEILGERGIELQSADAEKRLRELREMYEPYVFALSDQLLMPLPPWILPKDAIDNWKTSAWGRIQ